MEMDFLGHVLSSKGIRLDPKKVQVIKEWQSLMTMKGVWYFLGLINFYKKFIMGFLTLAKPFTDLFKKELSFEWWKDQEDVFGVLKQRFSTSPIFMFLNFTKPFEVHVDINEFVIRDVLM